MIRNYTRWTMAPNDPTAVGQPRRLFADILGARYVLQARPAEGIVELAVGAEGLEFSPDEARMLGVRLIEAAALADGNRAIRDRSG